MRQAGLLLMIVAFVFASPVLIPVAMVLHTRDQRRMEAAAGKARCKHCGTILGIPSLHRADAAWAAYVAKLHRDRPGIRFRLVRRLWAICVTCDAEYGYDTALRVFPRIREPRASRPTV